MRVFLSQSNALFANEIQLGLMKWRATQFETFGYGRRMGALKRQKEEHGYYLYILLIKQAVNVYEACLLAFSHSRSIAEFLKPKYHQNPDQVTVRACFCRSFGETRRREGSLRAPPASSCSKAPSMLACCFYRNDYECNVQSPS